MSGGLNVQYLRQKLDVAWYGRKCSKLIRNKVTNKFESPHYFAILFLTRISRNGYSIL
jgi:hypothetical protein